jgi:hypothetical protein
MADLDKALQTQLKNIQTKTGKSLDELTKIIKKSGLSKHGEIRDMLKKDLGLGHGDANTMVHFALKSAAAFSDKPVGGKGGDVLGPIYTGPKATLRPIHEALMEHVNKFGEFEIAPKKTYVSLRTKKQFAMIGPATNTRVEVGLNVKGLKATSRLEQLPAGQMCQYKVKVTDVAQVDNELIGWIKQAYDSSK